MGLLHQRLSSVSSAHPASADKVASKDIEVRSGAMADPLCTSLPRSLALDIKGGAWDVRSELNGNSARPVSGLDFGLSEFPGKSSEK